MPIDSLEQRIDTNKRNGMETQEIINFLNNDANVQELWKRLETSFNSNWLDHKKNQKFHDAINNATLNNREFQNKIQNKINKGLGQLTDSDVFLLYLQSLIDPSLAFSSFKPIISQNGDIYTRYGWQILLNYIRTKYKNPKYEFWRWWPNILPKPTAQPNNPKKWIEIQKKEPELPNNISFDTFWENNTYMPKEFSKLDSWAKENFPTEYNNEKVKSWKRNAEKWDRKTDYIKLDLYRFSLKKYQELLDQKHKPIYISVYWSKEKYEEQQNLAKVYFEEIEKISNQFPNIEETIKRISDYFNELEKLQKKHLKNEKEEDVQKKYELYSLEVNQRWEKVWIKEAQESLKKEPKSGDDAIKYWENFNKLMEFENEKEWIKRKYGKSIDNYENYLNEKWNLITKYWKENLQQWINTYKQYLDKINECKNQNEQFDENKYKSYTEKLSKSGLSKHFENIQILYNSINTKDGIPNNFPIRGIVEENKKIKKEQEEIDRERDELKKDNRLRYQIKHIWIRWINTLISSQRWAWAKLWAVISRLWHDDDEMVAVLERTNNWFWNPHFNISTKQSQPIYEKDKETGEAKITFNWDNGPWIIAESVVNMFTLIYWGWAIAKGLTKWAAKLWANMWAKLASWAWLVSSGFIQQVWNSFQEWFNAWMTWNQALLYGTTSALIQWSLELISPNEFINWLWKNVAKTYIKELLKTWSKQSLKAIGKAFLKNVWSEIWEEIFQEEVQLAAWNLINMWANNQYDIPKDNELGADRHRKNFTATALVTALTTWIVAWWWFAMQTPWMLNTQNRAQLIEEINKNAELYSDVMNVIDKAIAWKVKIPNVDVLQLKKLKIELSAKVNVSEWEIRIPATKLEAPNEKFAETDESFREIVTKNQEKIKELNEIQDMDEFIRQSFEYIKWEMWLNPNITLKITDDDNHYNVKENTVYISRNRTWVETEHVQWKWDKAEIFWGLVHELNHYLQRKEFILNFDQDSKYRAWVINYLQKYPQANENIKYIIANYPDNIELQEAFEKAKKYWENLEHYIDSHYKNWKLKKGKAYDKYKNQLVEEESFRRWDLVVEEYRRIINQESKNEWNIVIPAWKFASPDFYIGEDWTIYRTNKNTQETIQQKSKIEELVHNLTEDNKEEIIGKIRIELNNKIELEENESAKNYLNSLLDVINDNSNEIDDIKQRLWDIESSIESYRNWSWNSLQNKLKEIRNRKKQAIETSEQLDNDYFNWKSHQFEVTEDQARSNSKNMDKILSEINEQNKSKKLEELRKEITEQYKQATWEELKLGDEQLLSILDAHEQDWILWELTMWQLRKKVKVLNETITDPKVRRFLFEAGFCWSLFNRLFNNKSQDLQPQWNNIERKRIESSKMSDQEKSRFNRNLDKRLTNLQPTNKINIWNWTIIYSTNRIVGKNSWREYIIWYTFDNNGTMHLRQFYRSKSEWCWRACPGMRKDGNLSKWEFITDFSYETTTKVDLSLWNTFDNLKQNYYNDFWPYNNYFSYSPISYIASSYKKNYILSEDMWPQNIYIRKLFPNLVWNDKTWHNKYNATDFYAWKYWHTIESVIKWYNNLIPEGLDYKHMKLNPNKSYSYYHEYLWKVNVQVCTIKRNGIDLDFHFAKAIDSPDKARIENVVTSDAQLNSWGLYNKQINAWPLVAKPVDYAKQCPNWQNIDKILPKIKLNPNYRDIRDLYQLNPIIKKFKEISK